MIKNKMLAFIVNIYVYDVTKLFKVMF